MHLRLGALIVFAVPTIAVAQQPQQADDVFLAQSARITSMCSELRHLYDKMQDAQLQALKAIHLNGATTVLEYLDRKEPRRPNPKIETEEISETAAINDLNRAEQDIEFLYARLSEKDRQLEDLLGDCEGTVISAPPSTTFSH